MKRTGETAKLSVLDDGQAVTLSQIQCREIVRMLVKLDGRAPVHTSAAVGKALLAALSDDDVGAILHRRGSAQLTPHTIGTPAALRTGLAVGSNQRIGHARAQYE